MTPISFRPTEDDARILREAAREGEARTDVIRRALHLLEREQWTDRARADAHRLAGEQLADEPDAW